MHKVVDWFKNLDNPKKVALISFFSSLYFYLPILTIYYQRRGLDFVQINFLWGIITATIFLAEVPTGIIADKIGRRSSIIIALILQLFGEIFFLFGQSYFHFVLISVIAGVGFAFQSGCIQALVYDSLKSQKMEGLMKKVQGNINAFYQGGHLFGALSSSFLITQITASRISLAIILTIISVGISLIISLFLKEPVVQYEHSEKNPLGIFIKSLKLIRGNPNLKRIILLGLFATPFAGYLRNFHPPYFELANIPPFWLGISLTAGGVLAMLASKYAYRFEKIFGVEKGMLIATLIPAILYILMSLIISPVLAILLFTLNYGSMSLQDPLIADYYNIHIPSNVRATALSTINMFSSIYIAVIGLLIGWIANSSVLYAFAFMGIVVLLGAVIFRINETHTTA
ncbi:MAG: MFS transporter [bacterium]|nr:MFS transporter [bacterium]